MPQRSDLLQRIIDKIDVVRYTTKPLDHHQFAVTATFGPTEPEYRIGFCTQVRKGQGKFGTDQVLLRHADGSLQTHENQAFYTLTPEQEALAHEVFAELLAEENSQAGYRCPAGIHHIGFLVTK